MSDVDRSTWNFLANTYWYVSYLDLPALEFSPSDNLLSWKVDQTVWHISGYKNGYFWGVSSAMIVDADEDSGRRSASPQQRSMVGTVTANGQVQISFIRGSGLRESIVTGFGHMSRLDQQWVFQMQMATSGGGEETLHWANMIETRPGDPSWDNLPGVNCSVQSMLEGASYPQFDEG